MQWVVSIVQEIRLMIICLMYAFLTIDTSVKLKAMELPQLVTVCLACLLQYLEDFKLEAVLKLIRYTHGACHNVHIIMICYIPSCSHMQHLSGAQPSLKLNNCAVKNLEIFHNQVAYKLYNFLVQ